MKRHRPAEQLLGATGYDGVGAMPRAWRCVGITHFLPQLTSLGNPFAPLSYLSYATQRIPDGLSAYDPSTDHSQLGEGYDVVPIPFTVSPLGLIKKIRSIVGTRREWHGLTLEEEKWKEVMVGDAVIGCAHR